MLAAGKRDSLRPPQHKDHHGPDGLHGVLELAERGPFDRLFGAGGGT